MTEKEQTRLYVLNQVIGGQLMAAEAADLLGVSIRHVRRILAAYREEGAAALAHKNRGRTPAHAMPESERQRIIELARTTYAGANQQHYTELLAEHEGITTSRSTVRRILGSAGISSPRTRRAPKHRKRRERYRQLGMLVQIDGSPHDWLEGRGPWLTLVLAIDDATGEIVGALFREHEDALGYFLLLQQIITRHGRPLALYHDRHTIFEVPSHVKETLAEQLHGRRDPTQFGRALAELEIRSIAARSPQAKGRIERAFGVFQDRLVTELRLAGASSLDAATAVLARYAPRHNGQFTVPAAESGSAFRAMPDDLELDAVLCFKHQRVVAKDNVVRFAGERFQIRAGRERISYAKAKVEVQQRLDGTVVIVYQSNQLPTEPAAPDAAKLRDGHAASASVADAAVVGCVGMGAGPDATDDPGAPQPAKEHDAPRPYVHTPRTPSPNHGWYKSYKTMPDRFSDRLE